MSDDTPDLTDRQTEVITNLPASKPDLADHLGVAPTTVEGHLNAIQNKGIDVAYDRDANQWYLADERSGRLRQLSTRHKQSITREATEIIEDEQATLFRRLRRTDPLQAEPSESPDRETFCLILGDLHFGDLVEKEFWDDTQGQYTTQEVYSSKLAGEKVAQFGRKALRIKELMSAVTSFDDCYVFILGDIATGMYVYEGQWQHIDKPLKDQTEESVAALYQLISTLAQEFDTVQVRGVPGNHGTDKPSSAIGANTDLITYAWLDDRLRDTNFDNVDLRYSETHEHLNTTVRDWRFHVRHGDDEMEHVDETSRSESDWRGLVDEFDFHVAMKGHHHKPAFHKVMNRYPVFSSPSPKPGGEFASKIGSPDTSRSSDLGWVFGTSDTRSVTWQYLLDDR